VKGRTFLRVAVVVAIVLLLVLVVRVPIPFDVSDVSEVQLNGGTLRLVTSATSAGSFAPSALRTSPSPAARSSRTATSPTRLPCSR
jgi:hypothetical protein